MARYDDEDPYPEEGNYKTQPVGGPMTDEQTHVPQAQNASPFDREGFRDAWMGTGTNVGAQDDLLKQYGISLDQAGRGTLPTGETLDLRIGAKAGQNLAGWTGVAGGGQKYGQAGGYGDGGGGAGNTGVTGGGVGLDAEFRNALLKMMQGANAPFDPNDPRMMAQQSAFNRQREQGAQQQRAAMAERAAFNGLNAGGAGSGAFDTGVQGILESAGQDEAGFAASLAQQDFQQKRSELMRALEIANAVGAREEAIAMQKQLADMDNAFKYSQLGQQQGQFEDSMAFSWADWQQKQNRDAFLAAMGG